MAEEKPREEVRRIAIRAIDEGEVAEILRAASGREPTQDAVEGLRNTLADEAVRLSKRASRRARRRGRAPSAEDVGRAADEFYGVVDSTDL